MSRPLRLEFPGSLWHVGSKGNSGVRIFRDEHDRECFLGLLGRAVVRYRWTLLAYVLRRTYFELVIELAARTMSTGMQWLLSQYARWFNWRHDRVGHLFHHPFDGRLIERETFGLAVVRDVVLDPVRTALVERPEDFEWSSHRALIGEVEAPAWLATHEILGQFGAYAAIARERYKRFVDDGIAAQTLPWHDLVGGMYLGSELWIDEIQRRIDATPRCCEHPVGQRELAQPEATDVLHAVADVFSIDENEIRMAGGGLARMIVAWIATYDCHIPGIRIASTLELRSSSRVTRLVRECDLALRGNARLQRGVDACVATLRRRKCEMKI